MNSFLNKKILIVILGSLGLLVVDYTLKKWFIATGLNTNHVTMYYLLNWGSFIVVMTVGRWLISTQIGKGQRGVVLARFLLILAAFLINSSILIP